MARVSKGSQVPQRTPEMQAIYDSVMPRALAGEDMKELAKEYGIKYATLSSWRLRAQKNMPKPIPKAVTNLVMEVANQTAQLEVGQEIAKRNSAAEIKGFLLDNAADSLTLLAKLRGNIGRELSELSKGISEGIRACTDALSTGLVIKHAVSDGEVSQVQVKMSPTDLSNTVQTLGKLQKQLAELHNLPLGALDVAAIKLDSTPTKHQHMHLHASYGGDVEPLRGEKPNVENVIDATPAGENDMQDWQRRLMQDDGDDS